MTVTDAEVEAAARAMCVQGGFDPNEIMANDGPRWRYYVPNARAALIAASQARALSSGEGWLRERADELVQYAASFRGQEGSATLVSETMARAKSLRYAADELSARPQPPSKDNTNE